MKHLKISVKGKVQGVFFRASTKAVADQIGVKGYVMNRPDGTVYIEVEGQSFDLDMFLEWCQEGSDGADVVEVNVKEGEVIGFKDFEIRKKL